MKILYVEDNPTDADLTRRGLARVAPEYELEVVGTIRDAGVRLGVLSSFGARVIAVVPDSPPPFDLVLADLNLPDGNGLDLLGQIRAAGLAVAVVMLTSTGDEAAAVTALKSGADDYVVKRGRYIEALPGTLSSALQHYRESAARRAQPLQVLYAEQAAVDVSTVRQHLARHMPNVRLEVVHTARQLLSRLPSGGEQTGYDVVVVGYDLTDMNALEVLKEIRQARRLSIPALVVTSGAKEDAAAQAIKLGATDYLMKGGDFLTRLPIALENAHLRDQLERERSALADSEERFRQLAENIQDVFWLTDAQLKGFLYVSPAYESVWESSPERLYQDRCSWMERVHDEDRGRLLKAIEDLPVSGRFDEEFRLVGADGALRFVRTRAFPVRDASGNIYRIAGVARDITARKEQEARIQYLAYYDGLTELPNRALFMDRLRQALVAAEFYSGTLAVLVVDLDDIRTVNETLGHAAGDAVLRSAAARVREVLRHEDTVARAGYELFVVLPGIANAEEAAHFAQKMLDSLSAPFSVGAQDLHLGASVGISVYPRDAADAESLMKFAGTALHQAKDQGHNLFCFFSAEMNARARSRLRLETDLRRAIPRGELEVYYQPQMNVASGTIIGVEALLRWHHPTDGLLMPLEFVPIAEETNLIVPIGQWVLQTAIMQARAWSHNGSPDLRLAVNLSRYQLAYPGLVSTIKEILDTTGFQANRLELEITESAVMSDPESAIAVLQRLRALGIQLAMDDFGTGYSNLAYLKRFPLDRLKIDASLMHGVPTEKDDVGIVQAIIALADQLHLGVIAEGVETEAQRKFLSAHGCPELQGDLCGMPVPADRIGALLQRSRTSLEPATARGLQRPFSPR